MEAVVWAGWTSIHMDGSTARVPNGDLTGVPAEKLDLPMLSRNRPEPRLYLVLVYMIADQLC